MRVYWHQFWLLLCTLGLWWWGFHEPPPKAPMTGTVVGHDVLDGRLTVTQVTWTGPDGAPKTSRLARYGLHHEPGQVIAVYPVAGEAGVVEEWSGREWPWLGWLLALTVAHALALLAASGLPKPRFQAWTGSAVGLCWLALLWFVVLHASQARVDLLLRGVRAEAVVVDNEIDSPNTSRGRARFEAIVHFAAPAAQPPRDVQINSGTRMPDGARVPLLYLPEAPSRVLVLAQSGSSLYAWWLPITLVLVSLWLSVLWCQSRMWHWREATATRAVLP